jgi:hypothetical protein
VRVPLQFFSTAGLLLFIQMSLARCCAPSEADGMPVTPKYAEASARSDSQSAPVSAASSASSRQHLLKV